MEKFDPRQGSIEMHTGCCLYWRTNEAGGRIYTSDEIPTGVEVWDTCLIDMATLCEAIAIEFALVGVERRAEQRSARESASDPLPEGFVVFDRPVGLGGLQSRAITKPTQSVDVEEIEQLIHRLRNIASAYPEDIFPPLTAAEREALPRGVLDRISGAMGRFHAPCFIEAADALEALLPK